MILWLYWSDYNFMILPFFHHQYLQVNHLRLLIWLFLIISLMWNLFIGVHQNYKLFLKNRQDYQVLKVLHFLMYFLMFCRFNYYIGYINYIIIEKVIINATYHFLHKLMVGMKKVYKVYMVKVNYMKKMLIDHHILNLLDIIVFIIIVIN